MDIDLRQVCFILVITRSLFGTQSPIKVYTEVGETVTLRHNVHSYNGSNWSGPCYESKCNNLTIYFDGLTKNPTLHYSIIIKRGRRKVDKRYDLQISNMSMKNKGIYIVTSFHGKILQKRKYNILFKVKPSNMSIENLTHDGKIHGTEGEVLDLVCSVTSGLPEENLTWYKEKEAVQNGGPRVVHYSFTPTRNEHRTNFICVVNSEALTKPLKQKVTLDIKYRPEVRFFKQTPPIIEGDDYTLQCSSNSNPPASWTCIRKNGDLIKSCDESTYSIRQVWSRNDSGNYLCTVQNDVGEANSTIEVNILYPPDVTVSVLNESILHCIAKGDPNNTTYLLWNHYTDQGMLLRSFNGSEYLTLRSNFKTYMINGLYVCEATNGIPNTAGNYTISGNHSVALHGLPEILPSTKYVQYGKYNDLTTISIFIYSILPITEVNIFKKGIVVDGQLSDKIAMNEKMFGRIVIITGYMFSHNITNLEETDFTNYTFEVTNGKGSVNFTVTLKAEDVPKVPLIEVVSVGETHIVVMIKRNFDGGSKQTFVVEYKPTLSMNWTRFAVTNDTFGKTTIYRIQDLEYDTEYCIQVYSYNSVGSSNSSIECSIKTNAKYRSVLMYVIVAITAVFFLSVTTLIYNKGKIVGNWFVRKANDQENSVGDNGQEQVIDVAVENQAYLSFDSLPRMLPINGNQNANRNVLFKRRNCLEDHNLNYVELEFNEASQAFHIRGEDRTIYADIDHELTASPLESSESEEEKDNNEDEDDFMTLEDIAEFMNEKGITPLHE